MRGGVDGSDCATEMIDKLMETTLHFAGERFTEMEVFLGGWGIVGSRLEDLDDEHGVAADALGLDFFTDQQGANPAQKEDADDVLAGFLVGETFLGQVAEDGATHLEDEDGEQGGQLADVANQGTAEREDLFAGQQVGFGLQAGIGCFCLLAVAAFGCFGVFFAFAVCFGGFVVFAFGFGCIGGFVGGKRGRERRERQLRASCGLGVC